MVRGRLAGSGVGSRLCTFVCVCACVHLTGSRPRAGPDGDVTVCPTHERSQQVVQTAAAEPSLSSSPMVAIVSGRPVYIGAPRRTHTRTHTGTRTRASAVDLSPARERVPPRSTTFLFWLLPFFFVQWFHTAPDRKSRRL